MVAINDGFVNTNGVLLVNHSVETTWTANSSSDADTVATIQSNQLNISSFTEYFVFCTSQEDSAEFVLKGDVDRNRGVGPAVRMGASTKGYSTTFSVESGGNYTRVNIDKNGVFLALFNGSWAVNADHTLKITAVDNAGDVDLEAFVDTISVITHTDLAASTPITGGFDGMFLDNDTGTTCNIDDFSSGAAASLSLTGPADVDEGASEQSTGTGLDAVTALFLETTVGSYSVEQTIDAQTTTTLNFVPETGQDALRNDAGYTPINAVPLEATILAALTTPWQIMQRVVDGVNPDAIRNIIVNADSSLDVLQTMISAANTVVGQSIFATSLILVEDDMQASVPKVVDAVTFTWSADGTFVTDLDDTVVFDIVYFSPSAGQVSKITATVSDGSLSIGDSKSVNVGITLGF